MSKSDRRAAARERLKQEREREKRREKLTRTAWWVGGGALALAVVLLFGYAIQRGTATGELEYDGPYPAVAVAEDSSIVLSAADQATPEGAPVVDIWVDYQCPVCRSFELEASPTVLELAATGQAQVVYHPVNIFTQEPLQGVSQRGGNASMCMAANAEGGDEGAWAHYADTLFRNQPREGSEGFSQEDLVGWAADVGVESDAFTSCLTDGTYLQALTANTEAASAQFEAQGGFGTPTVTVNGQVLRSATNGPPTGEDLTQAVAAAQGQAPLPEATTSPSAEPGGEPSTDPSASPEASADPDQG
ncbi:DsbA family protein [Allonocardiopsis opalescens]|uniref:Thioredoxin-like protein n=1 Tax=Allonocardiopsis opalescens TaxID=1144618 RepID=A0A2T0Q492_9ACTN|nr:thioredoxin domain-containing protein [Allonocardiopsis opalescens]PRX98531.1 thioredoxin-like protein [Allonocardiopsis opalescens]